jgi:hypothetical protein
MITPRLSLERSYNFGIGFFLITAGICLEVS